MRTAIQIKHTGKVTRVTYVHSISDSCDGWPGIIFTCLQVLIKYIVAIVGSNKTFDRQAHLLSKQAGCDVTKVSARYTNHCIIGFSGTLQLGIGIEIIECLRQKTSHIDRIGGGQRQMFVQFLIHESSFYQRLAIVKRSVHFESSDILS